jgi:integrase
VIEPELAAWLLERRTDAGFTIPDPEGLDRGKWFETVPQKWLRTWVKSGKPLHRLRGLYADHIARLTADAVAARLAGIKAAQNALGHTTPDTTEGHYLTPDA